MNKPNCCDKCIENPNREVYQFRFPVCTNPACECHTTPTNSAPRTYHYDDPEFGGKIELTVPTPEIAKLLEVPKSTPEHGSIMDVVKGRSKALWPSPEVEKPKNPLCGNCNKDHEGRTWCDLPMTDEATPVHTTWGESWKDRFEHTKFARGGGSSFECSDFEGMYTDLLEFFAAELSHAKEEERERGYKIGLMDGEAEGYGMGFLQGQKYAFDVNRKAVFEEGRVAAQRETVAAAIQHIEAMKYAELEASGTATHDDCYDNCINMLRSISDLPPKEI